MPRRSGSLYGTVSYIVRDRDGRVIQRHKQRMHSFVGNFLRMMANLFSDPRTTTSSSTGATSYPAYVTYTNALTTTGNASYTPYVATMVSTASSTVMFSIMGVKAPADETRYGIVIGKGTTAVSMSDVNLASPYTSNEFIYSPVDVSAPSIGTTSGSFNITRNFVNKTASTLSVTEAGIIALFNWQYYNTGTSAYYLIARDLFSTPASVPSYSTLQVIYTFTVTV